MGATVAEGTSIAALLGPTNTGKTHRAVERMLEHHSGMIGLPLRLLAREVYDRMTARIGEKAVALVTGEEKRIPAAPRYWVCTVESMPVERTVDFLAVDEVQLAAHPQRGHVFTDRLLHARGRRETWFMGSDSMRPIFESLVPSAEIRRHPRLSRLSAREPCTLGTLPVRSAVVAFSAREVYEIAEKLRHRRGGAAVVMGALSPRTRNAQVAMYQAGEVDFLVATDAVGMGLNMDVDHVAFAALTKFDGQRRRALAPAELAQIAGRAGRHTRDGTFGGLSPVALAPEVAFAVESHRFAPVRRVQWRNADLDLSSVSALLASLTVRPPRRELAMVEQAEDVAALELLRERPEIAARARGEERVTLLWDVCRIPDFRKLLVEHHAGLLSELYVQICDGGRVDPRFMHDRIGRLENAQGDIDTLLMRMDFIRTWNYVAHRSDWVDDAASWQVRTQRAEDELSEALHARLVERFVERRAKGRASRPGGRSPMASEVSPGREDGPFAKLAALRSRLAPPEEPRFRDDLVEAIVDAPFEAIHADASGAIWFSGEEHSTVVGRLTRGVDLLHPDVKVTLERLGAGDAARVQRRLRAWVRDLVEEARGPLADPRVEALTAAGRGLVYQLEQNLGSVSHGEARRQIRELSPDDRRVLDDLDVHIGRRFVYVGHLLSPDAVRRRIALCAASAGRVPLRSGRPASFPLRRRDAALCPPCGYAAFGSRGVRVDVAERLDDYLERVSARGPFALPRRVSGWLRCSREDAERVVIALGYHQSDQGFVRGR
jgi:ATP-dependent RNA helicase SUPV3L1/SUV3